MGEHLRTLILSILDNPLARIKELQIIPDVEKSLLLKNFNNTKVEYSAEKTIIDLFEEQVDKTPDNIAVEFEDVQLSYRELNENSNIVAHYLRRNHDIKPDDLIGVLQDRSEKMIIAILGILKSGAAYVPIDPEYPESRINFMLEDFDPKVVLCDSNPAKDIENKFVEISKIFELEIESVNPDKNTTSDNLAYVIYTSGSTGKPKGVLLKNRTLTNLIIHEQNKTNLDLKDKKIMQFAALSFDVCSQEIFSSLLSGGILCLIDSKTKKDPDKLFRYITEKKINILFFPTAYLKHLSKETDYLSSISDSVEHIIVAGEQLVLNDKLIEILKLKKVFLHNHYGPSETHVVTSLTLNYLDRMDYVPYIGKPISNTKIFILDGNKNLCPLGIPGELCISGDGLASEYLNQPDLTLEKFINNPYESGDRMYRTGDLAYWLPCGNIEFLGRIDKQVKIRGFRIELGEVENTLCQFDPIDSAVVISNENSSGETYLIAYYCSEKEIGIPTIRNFLSDLLPDYMIPFYYIYLDEIPLTTNGKVNRKLLPEPDITNSSVIEYIAPVNEVEERLSHIWQSVLGVGEIGTNDNFFELGGHSLKAIMLTSRIFKHFDTVVPIQIIFQKPTIKLIAEYISTSSRQIFESIQKAPTQEHYPVSSAQNRLYLINQMDMKTVAYNLSTIFYFDNFLDINRFNDAINKLIKRHEALRTSFYEYQGKIYQKIHEEKIIDIEIIECPDNHLEIDNYINNFIQPFNLNNAPLIRVQLLKFNDQKYLFMCDLHHIISDGQSSSILIDDLCSIYAGKSLPDQILQYKDYSNLQQKQLKSDLFKQKESFWIKHFNENIPVLNLPTDKKRPFEKSYAGSNLTFMLNENQTSKLNELVVKSNSTLFIVLISIYYIILSKYSGQEDIVIGTPVAGRTHDELERIVGLFINTLALRNFPVKDKNYRIFLQEVTDSILQAFSHQDYPFQQLVEKVVKKREPGRNPLFDVMFVLQNNDYDYQPGTLKIAPYKYEYTTSKFDLLLNTTPIKNKIYFNLEYSTSLFTEESMFNFRDHFKMIIDQIINNQEIKIYEIDLLGNEEKQSILSNLESTTEILEADFNL